MSRICTTIMPGDACQGDLFEIRWDLLGEDVAKELSGQVDGPVLLTLRSESHGGRFTGSREKVLKLARLQPEYLDLEYPHDVSFISEIRRLSPKTQCLLSYHGQEPEIKQLESLWRQLRQVPADLYKIALPVLSCIDALRMLLFAKAKQNEAPLIVVAMGDRGQASRILAGKVGMPFTFAYSEGGESVAPGQLSFKELRDIYGYYRVDHKTRPTGLIGLPVDGSIGHYCHNAVIQHFSLPSTYIRFALETSEIPDFFSLAKSLDFSGLSVTMPHKEQVVNVLSCANEDAVNTIRRNGEGWQGISTDGIGAVRALGELRGRQVLLLGAGGAARAIARSLVAAGAELTIWNRTHSRARQLAEDIGAGVATTLPASCDLLVSALPKGVAIPQIEARQMMDINLRAQAPWPVSFKNGKEMYLNQAVEQVHYWWGLEDKQKIQEVLGQAVSLVYP